MLKKCRNYADKVDQMKCMQYKYMRVVSNYLVILKDNFNFATFVHLLTAG